MIFRDFNYFFFLPTTFEQFFDSFRAKYNFQSVDRAHRIYNDWLILFCQRSFVFYRAQCSYHSEIVEKAFCIEHGIPDGHGFSEYGLDADWEDYSNENGLLAHQEECENQCRILQARIDLARYQNNTSSSPSLGEILEESERINDEIRLHIRPTMKHVNEFWFNTTINNPRDVVSQLRKTPYAEYLRTEHWQRIRAAMMLVHKACCQAEGHYDVFESWYFGWESEINVHHLHYRNKGNERYSDIALLCKDHHQAWHSNARDGKPQFTILDIED